MKHMIAIVLVILTMTAALTGCNSMDRTTGKEDTYNGNLNEPANTPDTGYGMGTDKNADGYNPGTPDTGNDGTIDGSVPPHNNGNVIEDFGKDMKDMVDDAGRTVRDAVDGRSNTTGTGMTGGR